MKRCLLAKAVKTLIKSNLDLSRATINCMVKLQNIRQNAEGYKFCGNDSCLFWSLATSASARLPARLTLLTVCIADYLPSWLLSRTTQYSTLRSILWLFDSRLPTTASWLQQLRSGISHLSLLKNILSQLFCLVIVVCATHSQVDIFWQIFVLTLSLLIEIFVVHFFMIILFVLDLMMCKYIVSWCSPNFTPKEKLILRHQLSPFP